MAEVPASDRLYPSLLDRLRDDEPDKQQESRDNRVISMQKLREYVKRDLSWLMNSTHLQVDQSLDDVPQVASSVVNYGVPGLSGSSVDKENLHGLEAAVTRAIKHFEPRINADTLSVRIQYDQEAMNRNAMVFEVDGEIWGDPLPSALYLKTEVDLETGDVTLAEQ